MKRNILNHARYQQAACVGILVQKGFTFLEMETADLKQLGGLWHLIQATLNQALGAMKDARSPKTEGINSVKIRGHSFAALQETLQKQLDSQRKTYFSTYCIGHDI